MNIIICNERKTFFKGIDTAIIAKFPEVSAIFAENAEEVVEKIPTNEACVIITAVFIPESAQNGQLEGIVPLLKNTKIKNPACKIILCSGEPYHLGTPGIDTTLFNPFGEDFHERLFSKIKSFISKAAH